MARLLTRVVSLGKKHRQFRGQQGLDWVYFLKTKRKVSMGWPLDFWFEEVNEKTRYIAILTSGCLCAVQMELLSKVEWSRALQRSTSRVLTSMYVHPRKGLL